MCPFWPMNDYGYTGDSNGPRLLPDQSLPTMAAPIARCRLLGELQKLHKAASAFQDITDPQAGPPKELHRVREKRGKDGAVVLVCRTTT